MSAESGTSLIPFAEPGWHSLPSPYYKNSHRRLRAATRAFVEEHLMENVFDWEEAGQPDHDKLKEAAKAGMMLPFAFGAHIEEEWVDEKDNRGIIAGIPAKEWDGFHDYVMIDELNRIGGLGTLMGLYGGCQIGFPPISRYGSESLKKKVIPPILRGEKRVCLAITEPEAGSDVKNLSTTAVKSADGTHYLVNGSKKWITNAIWSDYFTTAVRTSGKPGDAKGISFLLIPRLEGVQTRKMKLSGTSSAGTSYLDFEDVKVPVEYLLGEEGKAFSYVLTNFNHERMMIAYNANRMARCCIEDALSYASTRMVFNQTLLSQPVIRFKFAHMARVVESQQAWIESLIYQLEHLSHEEGNKLLGGTTALLKAHTGLVLELVAREAVQIVGGIGYTRGGRGERIERINREVRGITIPGGSEEVMLDLGVRQAIKTALGLGAKL